MRVMFAVFMTAEQLANEVEEQAEKIIQARNALMPGWMIKQQV